MVLFGMLAGLLAVTGIALGAMGPIVRARIQKEADRRELDIEVGGVRPGFFTIALKDVHVRPRKVPGLEARLARIDVDLSAALHPSDVRVHGGTISVEGEPDEVASRLRELRGPRSDAAPSGNGSHVGFAADELEASWRLASGAIVGAGISVERTSEGLRLGCAQCTARHEHLSLEVGAGKAEVATDGTPQALSAASVAVVYTPPPAPPAPPSTAAPEFVPPPLPTAGTRRKGKAAPPVVVPAKAAEPSAPVLPLPDLHALRGRIATALAAVAPRIADGTNIEIAGLSARREGSEPVAFGPGTFTLRRGGPRLHLGFASANEPAGQDRAKGTPLSIDADLPLAGGEMSVRLAGGPVSLAMLGVRDGMKGLTDVENGAVSGKGQLVLSDAADALTFDGEISLRNLSMKEARISPEPLRKIDLTLSGHGLLDDHGKLRVDGAELAMGALHVRTHGTIEETADHFAVALGMDVAPAACQALLDSAPQGLLPTVRQARMTGSFAANVNLAFDTRTIDKLVLDYRVDDQCRLFEVPPELAKDRFGGVFTYRTYKPDGATEDTTSGPGSASWTPLDDISPFMVAAVLTTEDAGFYKHHGFNHGAIRGSVAANLKARRFVRGASTISMQLAKNLFLARDKALSRKIEEVILTDYLEQVFTKDDMMELYLNVVEFGPDVYGITRAAEYYFGRKPEELNLVECYFLATLLPSPVRYSKLRERGGEALEGWTRHLRALMEIAAKTNKITRAELEEGQRESLVFVHAGEARPEPRKPVTSTRRDPYEDDSAWRPLD